MASSLSETEVFVPIARYSHVLAKIACAFNVSCSIEAEQKESQILLADDERIVCRMNVPEMLEAPVKRRDKIGRVTFLLDGQILASYPVLAEQSIERRTFFRVLEYVSEKFFH